MSTTTTNTKARSKPSNRILETKKAENSSFKANGHSKPINVEEASFPEYIPASIGAGTHRKSIQRRTLTFWLGLAAVALAGFNEDVMGAFGLHASPRVRAAVLSLLFPGAGYIACANVVGGVLFLLTWAAMPLCLLAWFGAGGLAFPLALWILSVGGAYASASQSGVFEKAGHVAGFLFVAFLLFFNRLSARARSRGAVKREQRNEYLPQELRSIETVATLQGPDEDRELSLEELRRVQLIFDMGSQAIDDFSNYTIIDQFQPAALRYQLYEMMYCLAMYQCIYTPNFHGYSAQVFRNLIDKSLTSRVLGFWRWEATWGKFTTDWDPVLEDNIMVSGWLLQGLAFYTANTGDMRYTKPRSLRFEVDKNHIYEHDMHTLSKAVVRQWDQNPFTLFPCEPNWIYSPCNLQGWIGQVVYDRIFATTHTQRLSTKFEDSLLCEFGEPDGSILPIRSELTGFTIPGLCGALGDLSNAMFCRGHMNHIARRMWAIFRHENIQIDNQTGALDLVGLVGADLIDPGNYRGSAHAIYAMVAHTAGEFGDEEVRLKALEKLEKGYHTVVNKTGSVRFSKEEASFSLNTSTMKAHMLRRGDWDRVISKGIPDVAMQGPILDSVPYPGVLVARARSLTSEDLSLVLYPSGEAGKFEIGVTRLQPGQKYVTGGRDGAFTADAAGNGSFKVHVDGRTAIHVRKGDSET